MLVSYLVTQILITLTSCNELRTTRDMWIFLAILSVLLFCCVPLLVDTEGQIDHALSEFCLRAPENY